MSFDAWVLEHEPAIRLTVFVGVFVVVGAWESISPRRALVVPKASRWVHNMSLVALNTVLVRLVFPLAAAGFAALCASRGWGLLNQARLPAWIAWALAVMALDFVIWLQHVMLHAVPLLWRLHRVHHADLDYDVTTGARFHPLEIVLSMGIKFAAIALLGPPVVAVVAFEVLLNATSMFNHGNIRLPTALDRVLRWLVVTPDMHRVHHSTDDEETNSNFGFNLPWWDRLFGTYRPQPRSPHETMEIGLRGARDVLDTNRLPGMLAMPWRAVPGGYDIARRRSKAAQRAPNGDPPRKGASEEETG
ncbi:MAG TPA: sterol desaturase family protein [Burkholderiaceae bacterium]|nr:sterol desaturase family protein [Burkholderiaceae bacterium]